MSKFKNDIFYDLEGPLSGRDGARTVCDLYVKDGDKLFPVLSRYDDLLALANKEGYEPGDTLWLMVPFLIEAGVTETDIRTVALEAGLVPGIREFFAELQRRDLSPAIISTSYEQHALTIAERLSVPRDRVYCTKFPLDIIQKTYVRGGKIDVGFVSRIREKAVKLFTDDLESGASDEAIKKLLNPFFWDELPQTRFGEIARVEVIGGRRKVKALEQALGTSYLSEAFVVMDSITDFRMAQAVEAAGGIAVAWNANWFLIPWASCGVAATDARAVQPLFEAWQKGRRPAVREFIESAPLPEDPNKGPYYHWLAGEDDGLKKQIILPFHKRLRVICRGLETAKLG